MKVETFHSLFEKSYNKTVIDFNFGRYKDLSALKSDIHLGLVASVNKHIIWWINPHVYLIEVNKCIICWMKAQTNLYKCTVSHNAGHFYNSSGQVYTKNVGMKVIDMSQVSTFWCCCKC